MGAKSARGEETRLRIIQAAANLFHRQGIHLTSPDEIIEASGTGKGQFYHYFKNKNDLVHEVMQTHLEMIRTGKAPVNFDVNSWEELEQWFFRHIELQRSFNMLRGCPIGTVGNDLTENHELIRQDICLIFEVMRNKLAAFFLKEKAKGRLAADADEQQMASFCIATIQGAMLIGKVMRDSQPVEETARQALAHLKRQALAAPARKASSRRRA